MAVSNVVSAAGWQSDLLVTDKSHINMVSLDINSDRTAIIDCNSIKLVLKPNPSVHGTDDIVALLKDWLSIEKDSTRDLALADPNNDSNHSSNIAYLNEKNTQNKLQGFLSHIFKNSVNIDLVVSSSTSPVTDADIDASATSTRLCSLTDDMSLVESVGSYDLERDVNSNKYTHLILYINSRSTNITDYSTKYSVYKDTKIVISQEQSTVFQGFDLKPYGRQILSTFAFIKDSSSSSNVLSDTNLHGNTDLVGPITVKKFKHEIVGDGSDNDATPTPDNDDSLYLEFKLQFPKTILHPLIGEDKVNKSMAKFEFDVEKQTGNMNSNEETLYEEMNILIDINKDTLTQLNTSNKSDYSITIAENILDPRGDGDDILSAPSGFNNQTSTIITTNRLLKTNKNEGAPYKIKAINASIVVDYTLTSTNGDTRVNIRENARKTLDKLLVTEKETTSFGSVDLSYNIKNTTDPYLDWMKAALGHTNESPLHTKVNNSTTEHGTIVTDLFSESTLSDDTVTANEAELTLKHKIKTNFDSVDKILKEASKMVSRGLKQKLQDLVTVAKRYDYHSEMSTELAAYKDMEHELQLIVNDILVNMYNKTSIKDKVQKNIETIEELISNYDVAIKVEDSSRIFDQTVLSLLDATKISDDDNNGHLDDNYDLKLTFKRVGEYDDIIDKLTSQTLSVDDFKVKVDLPDEFDDTTKGTFVDILESLFKSKKETLAEAYNPPDNTAWIEVTIDKNTIKTYCWENTSMRPVIKYCKNASGTEPVLEDSDKLNYAAYVASMALNSSGMDIGSSNFSTKAAVTTVASDTHPKLKLCAVNCYGSLKYFIKEVKLTDANSNISSGEILDDLQPSEGSLHNISLVMAATLEEKQELSDNQTIKYSMNNTENTQVNLFNSRIFHRIIHAKQTIWDTAPISVNKEYNTKKLKSLENEIRCTNVKWSAGTLANVGEKQVKDLKDPSSAPQELYELNTFSNKLNDISKKRADNNNTSGTSYVIDNSRSDIYNAVSGMSTTGQDEKKNKIVVDYLMWQFCNFTNKKNETRQLGLELLWMTHVDSTLTIYNEAYDTALTDNTHLNSKINNIPGMILPSPPILPSTTKELTSVISGPFKVELTISNGKVATRQFNQSSQSNKFYTWNTDASYGKIVLDIDQIQRVTSSNVELPGSNASVLYHVNINIIGDISDTSNNELPEPDLKYKSFSVDISDNDFRSRLMPVYKVDASYNSSNNNDIYDYTQGLFDDRIVVWGTHRGFNVNKINQLQNHAKYYLQYQSDVNDETYTDASHNISDNTFLENRRALKHSEYSDTSGQAIPLYRPYNIPVRASASKPANEFAIINYVDALDVSGTASILGKYSIYSNNNSGSDISGVELTLKTQKFTQTRGLNEVSSLVCSFEFNDKNYVAIYKPKSRDQSVIQTSNSGESNSGESGHIKFKAILPSSFSSTDISNMNNLVNAVNTDTDSNIMELMLVRQVVSDPFKDDNGVLMESRDTKLNERFSGDDDNSYTQKLISFLSSGSGDPTELTKTHFEQALEHIVDTHTDDAADTENVKLTNSKVTNLRVLFTLTAPESEPTSPSPNSDTGAEYEYAGADIVFQNHLSTTSLALVKTTEKHIKSATFKLDVNSVKTLLDGEGSSGAPGFYSYNTTSLADFNVEDWITQTFTVTDNDIIGESTLSRTAGDGNLTVDVDMGNNKTYKIIARRLNDDYIYTIYDNSHNSITYNDDAFKNIKLDVKFGWKKDYYYNGTANSLISNKNSSDDNSPPDKFNMTSSGQTNIDSHTNIFSDRMLQLDPRNISIDIVNKAAGKRDHDIDHIHYRLSGFDNLNTQNNTITTVGKIIYDKIKIEGTLPDVSVSATELITTSNISAGNFNNANSFKILFTQKTADYQKTFIASDGTELVVEFSLDGKLIIDGLGILKYTHGRNGNIYDPNNEADWKTWMDFAGSSYSPVEGDTILFRDDGPTRASPAYLLTLKRNSDMRGLPWNPKLNDGWNLISVEVDGVTYNDRTPTRLDVFDAAFDASLNELKYTMVKSDTDMVITRDTTNDPVSALFNVTYLTALKDNQLNLLTLLKEQRYVIKDAYAETSPDTEYKIKISELLVTDYSLKTLYNIDVTLDNEADASEGAEKVLLPNTLLLQPTRNISGVAVRSDDSDVKYGRKVLYRADTNILQTTSTQRTELDNYKRMLNNSSTGTYPTISVKYTFKVTFKTDRDVDGTRRKLTEQDALYEATVTYDTTTGIPVTKLERNSYSVVEPSLLNTSGITGNNFDKDSSANICLDLVKVVDTLNAGMVTAGKAVLFGMKAELTKVEISETKPEPVNAVARNGSGSGVISKTVTGENFDVFDIHETTDSDLVNFDTTNNRYGDSCLVKKLTWNNDDVTFIRNIGNNVVSYDEDTSTYKSYSVTATNSNKQYTFELYDTVTANKIMSGSTRQTASTGDWTHNKINDNDNDNGNDYIQFANANLSGTKIYRMEITPNLEITHNNTSVIYEGNSKTGYVKTTNIKRDPTESYPIYINDFSVSTTRKAHSAETNKNNFGWSKKCSYVMENLQIDASNNELFKSITSITMGGEVEAVQATPEIGKFVENVWTPSKLKISLKNIGEVGVQLSDNTQVLDDNGNNYFAKNFTGFIRNYDISMSMVVPANGENGVRVLNNSTGLTLMTTNTSHTYWKYDTESPMVGRDQLHEFTFNGTSYSLKLPTEKTWNTDTNITNTFTSWEDLRSDESRDPTTGYWSSIENLSVPNPNYIEGWDTKNYYDIWKKIEIEYAIEFKESTGNGKLLPAPVDNREITFKTTILPNEKHDLRNDSVKIQDSFSAIVQSDKDSLAKIKTNTTWSTDGNLKENTLSTQMDPHKILNVSLNTNNDSDGIYFNPAGKSFANNTYYINNALNDASVVYNKYQTYAMKIAFKAKTAANYKTVINLIDGNLDHSIKGTLAYENNTPYNFHKKSGSMLVAVTDTELQTIKNNISAITTPSNDDLGRKWSSQNGDIENEKIRVYFGLDKQSRRTVWDSRPTGVLHNSAMVAPKPSHNASGLSTVICLPGEDKVCGQTTGADIGFKYGEGFDIKITYCYIEYNITTITDASGVSEDVRTEIKDYSGENVVELSTDEQVKDKVLILDKTIDKDTVNKTIEVIMRGGSMTGSSVTNDGHHVLVSKFTNDTFNWEEESADVTVHQDTDHGGKRFSFPLSKLSMEFDSLSRLPTNSFGAITVKIDNINYYAFVTARQNSNMKQTFVIQNSTASVYDTSTGDVTNSRDYTQVHKDAEAARLAAEAEAKAEADRLAAEAEAARLAALQPSYEVELKISDAAYGEWTAYADSNASSTRFKDVVIRVMGTDDDGVEHEMGKTELNTANKDHVHWHEVNRDTASGWSQAVVTNNFADFDGLTRYDTNIPNFSDTNGALDYLTTNRGLDARKGAYKFEHDDDVKAIDDLTMGFDSGNDKLTSYIKTTINLQPKAGKKLSNYTNINIVVDDSAHFGKPIPLTPNGYSNTYIPSMMTTKLNGVNKSYGSIGNCNIARKETLRWPIMTEFLNDFHNKEISLLSVGSRTNGRGSSKYNWVLATADNAARSTETWWDVNGTDKKNIFGYYASGLADADGTTGFGGRNTTAIQTFSRNNDIDNYRFKLIRETAGNEFQLESKLNSQGFSSKYRATSNTTMPNEQSNRMFEFLPGTVKKDGNNLKVDVKVKDMSDNYLTFYGEPTADWAYDVSWETEISGHGWMYDPDNSDHTKDQVFTLIVYDVSTSILDKYTTSTSYNYVNLSANNVTVNSNCVTNVIPTLVNNKPATSGQITTIEDEAGFSYIQDLNYTHQYEMLSDWNKTMNCLIMDITVKKTFDGSSTTKNLAVRTLYPDKEYPDGNGTDMIHSPLFPTNGTYYKADMNFLYSGLRGIYDLVTKKVVKVLQIDRYQASLDMSGGTMTPLDASVLPYSQAEQLALKPLRIASPLPEVGFVSNAHANRLSLQCIGRNVICGIELNNLDYVDSMGSKELITKDASLWFTQLQTDGVLPSSSRPNNIDIAGILSKFEDMGFVKDTYNDGCVTWDNSNTSAKDNLKAHSEKAFEWLEASMTGGNPAFQSLPLSIKNNLYLDALKADIAAANDPSGIETNTKYSSVLEYHIGAIEFRMGDKWKLSTTEVNGKTQIWRELK